MFVLANEPQWLWTDPVQALRIWQGGYGVIGGGGLTLISLLRHDKKLFGRLLDWTVPGIAIAIALVRMGNIVKDSWNCGGVQIQAPPISGRGEG